MSCLSHSRGAKPRAASAFGRSSYRAVEALEARVLLSIFVVTNTADSGAGSLRQAILSADSTVGPNAITFSIFGTGVHTIAPTSALPVIAGQVTIDGTTQPGYSSAAGAPVIELYGGAAGGGASGLVLGTSFSTSIDASAVKGLIISGFANQGIILQGKSEHVQGCYIGLDAVGDTAFPNGGDGIEVLGTSAVIGGSTTGDRNVISGNGLDGIVVRADGATITGNYIGTNAIGSSAVGNRQMGVRVLAAATIGGAGPLGNVISGNGSSGIYVKTAAVVQIAGNRIGTNAAGTAAVGNGASLAAAYRDGITAIGDGITPIGTLSIGLPASGTAPPVGNVISGNQGNGVAINGDAADARLQIVSNLVGTDASGNSALGNAANGLLLDASTEPVAGNTISGNGADGVLLNRFGSLSGNNIGTNQAGTAAIPNGANGIETQSAGFIGSQTGRGNLISGNGGNGILVDGQSGALDAAVITNNLIGTDITGNVALGNRGDGILIVGVNNNMIKTVGQWRQVISGNGGAGISIQGSSSNSITGNYIGTNLAGTDALGNRGNGIELFDIGDTVTMNLVSANRASGVFLGEFPAPIARTSGTLVSGNAIGTDFAGRTGLGNFGDGVTIFRSSYNVIGRRNVAGSPPTPGNTISGNGGNGVTITSGGVFVPDSLADAFDNTVSQNSIYQNSKLGIDLGNDGVTPNSPDSFSNYPIIVSANAYPTYTQVQYQLLPSITGTVEFFADDVADPSGFGQGERFVGSFQVNSSQSTYTARLPVIPVGTTLTATATLANINLGDRFNTSEFAQDVTVIAPPPTVTHSAFDPQHNTINFTFSKDVSASLSPSSVRVHNQTSGADVAVTGVSYASTTNTASFQLPGSLPSGAYIVTLLARAVTDSSGEHLDGNGDGIPGDDYTFQFTVVSGDVNLDGAVSFDDLLILARNYGQAGTFSQGDLNHDGRVDFADLLILAQGYGQGAASPAVRAAR